MRSIFEAAPFARAPWAPALALGAAQGHGWVPQRAMGLTLQEGLETLIETGIEEGPGIYQSIQEREQAEEERKEAEAAAAAAASRAKQAAAQAKTAEAQAAAAGAQEVMGIPTPYLIVGGLGLAAIAVIIAVAT